MSIVIVTGAVAPYTHLLYEALAAVLEMPLYVLACVGREPARAWDVAMARSYRLEVMPGIRLHRGTTRNFYLNPAVLGRLSALDPRAVIVNDFSPTMVLTAMAAAHRGIPVGIRTDGVPAIDPGGHSQIRRLTRRAITHRSAFGIGPSKASLELLHSHGVPEDRLLLAPLTPGWKPSRPSSPMAERPYDVLFCGGLDEEVKGARFFAGVVEALALRRPGLTVRVAGDGPLRSELESRLAAAGIAARFDGFVQQDGLEAVYDSARVFMFPSRGDVWGIVANEAIQCGTPVIASPFATAAYELVEPAGAGAVLPLDQAAWVDAAEALLAEPERWQCAHDHALAAGTGRLLEQAVGAYRGAIERYAR